MADQPAPSPKDLAEDIFTNVQTLRANNDNVGALTALQVDAGILAPNPSNPDSFPPKMDLQRNTQQELDRLTAAGHVPKIEIFTGEGSIKTTLSTLQEAHGYDNTDLFAQSRFPTEVSSHYVDTKPSPPRRPTGR